MILLYVIKILHLSQNRFDFAILFTMRKLRKHSLFWIVGWWGGDQRATREGWTAAQQSLGPQYDAMQRRLLQSQSWFITSRRQWHCRYNGIVVNKPTIIIIIAHTFRLIERQCHCYLAPSPRQLSVSCRWISAPAGDVRREAALGTPMTYTDFL